MRVGPAVGCVRRRREGKAPGGLPVKRLAHDLVRSYTGLVGRGRVGASSAPSTKTVTSQTSRSSSGRCGRWSAASSSDTPPGYVVRSWFRYGVVSPGQRVLRVCSRAGALL